MTDALLTDTNLVLHVTGSGGSIANSSNMRSVVPCGGTLLDRLARMLLPFLLYVSGGGGAFRFGIILPCLLGDDIDRGVVEEPCGKGVGDIVVLLRATAVKEDTRGLGIEGGEKVSRLKLGGSVRERLVMSS